jgi:hypothetical protein
LDILRVNYGPFGALIFVMIIEAHAVLKTSEKQIVEF